MKRTRTYTPFLLLILSSLVCYSGEKSGLRWSKLEDALLEARKSNKKVLIDVYTDWCGWCKRMDHQTYSNTDVITELTKNYVLVKLDAESNENVAYEGKTYTKAEFSAAFGITGYPSTIFLGSDGEAITIYPGFADAERFSKVLSFIGEDHYINKTFDEFLNNR